ncbi:efflux RND transporter permease subunit [Paenisporosarcina antarctica]|uniref:Efflux RND transporter permease subunit n=1 Tax=Paenisporosarcina antarctica TaxID=417367 RepID=A0A4P7A217_9BACL|nr:efflux RND transporter permease subunit [Paenisporosarcina antarctica]QBP42971.1 efflux RND transporter permease subunit [Paenisporosarcina antarctica]
MNFLTKFSLKNATAVFIISFLLIVLGLYSFSRLKIDLLPNIEFPQLSVQVVYPGASPEDVDDLVITPIEGQLKGIEGATEIQSVSYETIGIINLQFPFDTDLDRAEQQTETAIRGLELPEGAETEISRLSFGSFPIFNISLFAKGQDNIEELLNKEVIPELNKIPGINSVSVGGLKEENLQITVNNEKATAAGLSLSQIKQQIDQKILSFPAGTVNDNDINIPVRVEEKLESIEKLKSLKLTSSFNSQAPPVELKDIATIEEVSKQSEITRYNQENALSMAVTKKQDANTVEVANRVINVLKSYDDRLDYAVGFDSAAGIEKSVETLVKEGLLGALFASIAVLIFLRNFRATIIAIISIPLSLLIAAIFLAQLDISLNIMTLGGMAVAVGRVVDDSIVVIENIFRRLRKTNDPMSNELVISSTKEILRAITASTLTTIVVFLPIGFVSGITGEFFLPFALTVIFSLAASLVVAVTIVPILARFAFKKVKQEEKEGAMQRFYERVILWSLNRKVVILVLSVILLGGSFALVPGLGFTFIPDEETKLVQASVELPSSTSLERTNEVSLEVEKLFADIEDIKDVTTAVGSRDFATGIKLENRAGYILTLNENVDVSNFVKSLLQDMDNIVADVSPDATISVSELSTGGPPSNNNVSVDLFASDLEALSKAASDVEAYMNTVDSLKYVSNNFTEKQKQVVVQIDSDKADDFGVSGFQLLATISDQTKPVSVGKLTLDDINRSVQLSYDEALTSIDEIRTLTIFTANGPVEVQDIATIEEIDSVTTIQKLDGKVFARIQAQIDADNIQKVSAEVKEGVIANVDLPDGVSLESGGGSDDTVEIFQQLGLAIASAIGLVYLTMLITFGQARIPFIILSSLIFVPIGALIGLVIAREPLSVSVMIGFLMLIGIVTTNAIVLVDRINQNRNDKGMLIRESLVEAGKTRLRPILMTAFATIAALIPLALTTSSGTLISKGLAVTVIGGLTSSTLLTLVIIPVMYEIFYSRQVKREKQAN